MDRPRRRRTGYANVTATLALVVALGGTSYAAVKLPRNSVGAPQLQNDAVTSAKVRNGSLGLGDLSATEVARLAGPVAARSYGVFRSNGTLVASRSKNAAVHKLPGVGQYCVTPVSGVDVRATTIIATPDYYDGEGVNHMVQVRGATTPPEPVCQHGYRLFTRTFAEGTFHTADIAVSFVIP